MRLDDFDLPLDKEIVTMVTDGRLVATTEHQLCIAHGIHIAVCDVLYKIRY